LLTMKWRRHDKGARGHGDQERHRSAVFPHGGVRNAKYRNHIPIRQATRIVLLRGITGHHPLRQPWPSAREAVMEVGGRGGVRDRGDDRTDLRGMLAHASRGTSAREARYPSDAMPPHLRLFLTPDERCGQSCCRPSPGARPAKSTCRQRTTVRRIIRCVHPVLRSAAEGLFSQLVPCSSSVDKHSRQSHRLRHPFYLPTTLTAPPPSR